MKISGGTTFGNCATGSPTSVTRPTITMMVEITIATIGRLMKNFDTRASLAMLGYYRTSLRDDFEMRVSYHVQSAQRQWIIRGGFILEASWRLRCVPAAHWLGSQPFLHEPFVLLPPRLAVRDGDLPGLSIEIRCVLRRGPAGYRFCCPPPRRQPGSFL